MSAYTQVGRVEEPDAAGYRVIDVLPPKLRAEYDRQWEPDDE